MLQPPHLHALNVRAHQLSEHTPLSSWGLDCMQLPHPSVLLHAVQAVRRLHYGLSNILVVRRVRVQPYNGSALLPSSLQKVTLASHAYGVRLHQRSNKRDIQHRSREGTFSVSYLSTSTVGFSFPFSSSRCVYYRVTVHSARKSLALREFCASAVLLTHQI